MRADTVEGSETAAYEEDVLNEAACAIRAHMKAKLEKVQKYLPEDLKFGLVLRQHEKDTFKVGFWRNGKLHTYRSQAEGLMLEVALTMAVSDLGGGAAKGKGK